MEAFEIIGSIIIFFGSVVYFLVGIERIFIKNTFKKSYATIGATFLSSYILLETGLILNDLPLKYPFSLFFFFTAIYLFGPMSFFTFHFHLYPYGKKYARHIFHYIPALIIFISEVLFHLQPVEFKSEIIRGLLLSPLENYFTPVWIVGIIHILFYYGYGIKVYTGFLKLKKIKTGVRLFSFVMLLGSFAVILLSIGIFIYQKWLIYSACIIISVLHLAVFIGMRRRPEYFYFSNVNKKEKKYKYSRLISIDISEIEKKLSGLIDEEKIFTDPDLTLQGLSRKLEITTYQLSQYLNEQLNLNFRNYVNKYRINEAKSILLSEEKPNILNICYKVGFNSISAFNRAFKKFNGESPTNFLTRNFN